MWLKFLISSCENYIYSACSLFYPYKNKSCAIPLYSTRVSSCYLNVFACFSWLKAYCLLCTMLCCYVSLCFAFISVSVCLNARHDRGSGNTSCQRKRLCWRLFRGTASERRLSNFSLDWFRKKKSSFQYLFENIETIFLHLTSINAHQRFGRKTQRQTWVTNVHLQRKKKRDYEINKGQIRQHDRIHWRGTALKTHNTEQRMEMIHLKKFRSTELAWLKTERQGQGQRQTRIYSTCYSLRNMRNIFCGVFCDTCCRPALIQSREVLHQQKPSTFLTFVSGAQSCVHSSKFASFIFCKNKTH